MSIPVPSPLLIASNIADFNQVNTIFTSVCSAGAADADLTAHAHGSVGDHGAPVTRGTTLVVTSGLTVSSGTLTVSAAGGSFAGNVSLSTGNLTVSSGTITASGDIFSHYLHTTDGSNGIVQSGNGSLYLRSAGGANAIIMDTGSGGLSVNAGPVNVPSSYVAAGGIITGTAGDLSANRGNNTGYTFLANGSHYIGFDGTNYVLPTSNLNIANAGILIQSAGNSGGANIAFPAALGPKLSLFDNGGNNFWGIGINNNELWHSIFGSGGVLSVRQNNGAGAQVWHVDAGGNSSQIGGLTCTTLVANNFTVDSFSNVWSTPATTGMTDGFIWISAANGPPSGTPAHNPGFRSAIYFDGANNQLCVWNTGWKKVQMS